MKGFAGSANFGGCKIGWSVGVDGIGACKGLGWGGSNGGGGGGGGPSGGGAPVRDGKELIIRSGDEEAGDTKLDFFADAVDGLGGMASQTRLDELECGDGRENFSL